MLVDLCYFALRATSPPEAQGGFLARISQLPFACDLASL